MDVSECHLMKLPTYTIKEILSYRQIINQVEVA